MLKRICDFKNCGKNAVAESFGLQVSENYMDAAGDLDYDTYQPDLCERHLVLLVQTMAATLPVEQKKLVSDRMKRATNA